MHSTKGVSPLVASVLLIAFSVAIATLLSGWFTSVTRSTTESITNKSEMTSFCRGASITIDQVYASLGTARATVRNSGLAKVNLVSAQYFNSSGDNFTTKTAFPHSLDRGAAITVEFNINMSSCPGGFSQVIITSDCSGAGATFENAPKCI